MCLSELFVGQKGQNITLFFINNSLNDYDEKKIILIKTLSRHISTNVDFSRRHGYLRAFGKLLPQGRFSETLLHCLCVNGETGVFGPLLSVCATSSSKASVEKLQTEPE